MEEILHQLRLVVYPNIYRVSYIPGGAGFLPSTGLTSATRLMSLQQITGVHVPSEMFALSDADDIVIHCSLTDEGRSTGW